MIDGKIFQNDILLGKWLELLDDLLLSFYTNFAGESEQILNEKEEFDDDLTKEHLNRLALLCDDNAKISSRRIRLYVYRYRPLESSLFLFLFI